MKVATDDMQWWRNKVNRIGQQCFNATCATWATHLLDTFVLTEVRTLEASGLPELAVQLEIPRKYLARTLAILCRAGLLSAFLDTSPVLVFHPERLSRRKNPAFTRRKQRAKRDREWVLELSSNRCGQCGLVFEDSQLELDHLI